MFNLIPKVHIITGWKYDKLIFFKDEIEKKKFYKDGIGQIHIFQGRNWEKKNSQGWNWEKLNMMRIKMNVYSLIFLKIYTKIII